MQRRLAQALLAVAVGCGILASTAAAASLDDATAVGQPVARQATLRGSCPANVDLDAPAATQESAMLCLIGEARERYGLPALSESAALDGSATEKSGDLLRCNEFSHTACGREFSFWIRESGYMSAECWRVGENLAWGVEEEGTVASIFRAWMRSEAHRENILGDFEETGIDLQVGQLGGLTGVHLWTQHFGSHCNS
ncbi:MAG TPA: CAP domain-containing protein [Solirubrobacterales bacterium]